MGDMTISPIQLAVILVGVFLIVHALTPLSQLAIVIWGIVIIILALLPGWNVGGRRIG